MNQIKTCLGFDETPCKTCIRKDPKSDRLVSKLSTDSSGRRQCMYYLLYRKDIQRK